MTYKRKPIMGLLYGEATGIGSELVVKSLHEAEVRESATWVLIGDERVFQQGALIAGKPLHYKKANNIEEVKQEKADVWLLDTSNTDPASIELGKLSVESGQATGETLTFATKLAQNNKLDGVVYAPLNKDALYKGGFQFEDDIHLLASLFGYESGFGEVNVMEDLWVTRATSHIPLKEVAKYINKERVLEVIEFANEVVTKAGLTQPKIVVAALNPHAGDGGLIGMEEIEEINPAVQAAQEKGINVEGPYPADTIFLRQKTNPFDCLVAMYHDQAQTGMKLMGFHKGVTINGGLPIVLNTPAHGTAFDIAGKGIANTGAMIHAMKLGVRMVLNQ
ncbi:PdxA family dehydrogenase [Pseudalkalibacillus decolorationis]|uniref:PdxA family dehydrogenase n=1 Tax=Pseudalkalibacillus decolorationis TaxID=163879 RepID=UPI002147F23F|nr:4-hydroxythreonine-4-phosphate dehydrogenase PdxA [Pseudalkalibacillus decolorationis]